MEGDSEGGRGDRPLISTGVTVDYASHGGLQASYQAQALLDEVRNCLDYLLWVDTCAPGKLDFDNMTLAFLHTVNADWKRWDTREAGKWVYVPFLGMLPPDPTEDPNFYDMNPRTGYHGTRIVLVPSI